MAFRLNAKLGNSYSSVFSKAGNIAAKTFNKISSAASSVLGNVLGGFNFSDIANTYKDFQQSMANTGAISGISKTSAEFRQLEEAALEAGRTTSKTAKEAADALGYMALAGWNQEQRLSGLMPILRLSEATGADLAATSDLVTDSMSAMGIEVSELNKYLDIAANANNKTNQTATQLMETYIGTGGMFKTLNTSMAEAAAISGVLANRGIKGSEAGTALNAILVNLMGNGRSSGKAFAELGVNAYTAEGKFRGITTVLKDVAKALDGASEQKIGKIETLLGGKTQMATLQALLSGITTLNSEGISELEELTAEFEKSEGSLQKMADAMRDTFSGALDILGSASDDVKIQIMKEIEPTLTPIIRKIADALPSLGSKVASFVKSAVRNIKSLWKEVSPFIQNLDFNKIKVGIMGLAGAIATAKIASKIKSISSAFKGFFSVVKANPLGLFVEALVALGTAFYEVHRQALKANLEKHFGDISLSIEQINDIADTVVDKKPFQKLFKALDISRELKEQDKALQEYINNIEQLNMKIDVGCTLTIDEQQQYKESVLNYIEGVNKYINDEWQRRNNLFSGDALMQSIINADMSSAWAQASLVGQELADYINQGINEKGFNIDKEKVMSMMSQLEEIKQQIAIETNKQKNKFIIDDFYHSDLSYESYKNANESIEQNNQEFQKAADEYFADKIGLVEVSYNSGDITKKEYNDKVAEITNERNESKATALIDTLNFSMEGLKSKYTDVFEKFPEIKAYAKEAIATEEKRRSYPNYNRLSNFTEEGKRNLKNKDISEKAYKQALLAADFYGDKDTKLSAENVNNMLNWSLEDKTELENIINQMSKDSLIRIEAEKILNDYDFTNDATKQGGLFAQRYGFITSSPANNPLDSEYYRKPNQYNNKDNYNEKLQNLIKASIKTSMNANNGKIKQDFEKLKKEPSFAATANVMTDIAVISANILKDRKLIQQTYEEPIEANIPATANTLLDPVSAAIGILKDKGFLKDTYEKSEIHANVKTELKTDLNKSSVDAQAEEHRSYTKEKIEEKKINAIVKVDVNAVLNKIEKSGFNKSLQENLSSIVKTNARIASIPGYASGTESTPDTFIAGENGAELITGSRGRKVYNALETANIFSNIGKIRETLVSSVQSLNVFNKIKSYQESENEGMKPERVVIPSKNINDNSAVNINITNNINIDGSNSENPENLKQLIDKLMKEKSTEIVNTVIDTINQNNIRKMRLAND